MSAIVSVPQSSVQPFRWPLRRPKTRRVSVEHLPGHYMTRRDKEIIKAVYAYRALSTPQINTLFFSHGQAKGSHLTRCNKRLSKLFHHGYLFRGEPTRKLSDGRKPFTYFIDRAAVPVLANEYGVFVDDIDWKPAYVRHYHKKLNSQHFEHFLAVNDVRVAVEAAAARHGFSIRQWLDEQAFRQKPLKERVRITTRQRRKRHKKLVWFMPDGYVHFSQAGEDYHSFIELDRATETRQRFAEKIHSYLQYFLGGHYEAQYKTDAMGVLTITTGSTRLANLKEVTRQLIVEEIGDPRYLNLFWFTTLKQVTSESVLTWPIWEIPGRDGAYPLTCSLYPGLQRGNPAA